MAERAQDKVGTVLIALALATALLVLVSGGDDDDEAEPSSPTTQVETPGPSEDPAVRAFRDQADLAFQRADETLIELSEATASWRVGALGGDQFEAVLTRALDDLRSTQDLVGGLRAPDTAPDLGIQYVVVLEVDVMSVQSHAAAVHIEPGTDRDNVDRLALRLRVVADLLLARARGSGSPDTTPREDLAVPDFATLDLAPLPPLANDEGAAVEATTPPDADDVRAAVGSGEVDALHALAVRADAAGADPGVSLATALRATLLGEAARARLLAGAVPDLAAFALGEVANRLVGVAEHPSLDAD